MDTHLTPINEDVVREREDAMRVAHERAATAFRAGIEPAATTTTTEDAQADVASIGRTGAGLDLLVVTLFAVLAAGFVSLVVTTLRI